MCGKPKFNDNSSTIVDTQTVDTLKSKMAEQGHLVTQKQVITMIAKDCGTCGRTCRVGEAFSIAKAIVNGPQGLNSASVFFSFDNLSASLVGSGKRYFVRQRIVMSTAIS